MAETMSQIGRERERERERETVGGIVGHDKVVVDVVHTRDGRWFARGNVSDIPTRGA